MGLNNIKIQKDFGKLKNWIGNKEVESKATQYIPLHTPYTGETIGEVPRLKRLSNFGVTRTSKSAFKLCSNSKLLWSAILNN